MNAFTYTGLGLGLTVLAASGAAAETFKKVGEEAGWEIMVNENMGPGCLIAKKGDGMQVQLGVDATSAELTGYMAIFTKADVNVSAGEQAPVTFEVGGKTFKGEAFGEQMDGFRGAFVPVKNPAFVYDLAKQETMKITVEGLDPIDVSLAGTDAAFAAMKACQESQ